MKKKQVDKIFEENTKRKNNIILSISMITIIFIFAVSFIFIYIQRSKNNYITYKEESNIDYKVYLKENDFFKENYLEANKQYIASLIDYITAQFKYEIKIDEENIDYKYIYSIISKVEVKDKDTKNSIYETTIDIKPTSEYTASSSFNTNITEDINIDYNYYNNLIKKFVNIYDLEDTISTLTINMKIKVLGTCETLEEDIDNETILTLSIPLTTKTTNIDIGNNVTRTSDKLLVCKSLYKYNFVLPIFSIFMIFMDIALIIKLIIYIKRTRTPIAIYEKELKKILNNYRSYIQKINNNIDLSKYQIMKVDTFTDMLEIRDTLEQPILMIEDKDKMSVYFAIPSNTKLLYVYSLKVNDIKK